MIAVRRWSGLGIALLLLSSGITDRAFGQDSLRVSLKGVMTVDEFRAAGLEKLSPEELSALELWMGRTIRSLAATVAGQLSAAKATGQRAIASSSPSPPGAGAASLTIEVLEGAVIIADDGEPLGIITTNCFSADALCNEFGRYGNEFSGKSIMNEFGTYGGEFSAKSPFNKFSRTPPKIFKNNRFVAYLSANASLSPVVDPHWLIGMLKLRR